VRLDRPAREALVAELEALPVEAAYLFGSQDAGEATPRCDVGLGALPDEGLTESKRRALKNRLSLRAAALFEVDRCDVVLVDDAPPAIAFAAIRGTLLVDRAPQLRELLEARLHSTYHDRRYDEERWADRTLDRFREDGFA